MTRAELIAHQLDMAESYRAMHSPYDTGEELHYQDYKTCIETAAELGKEDTCANPFIAFFRHWRARHRR